MGQPDMQATGHQPLRIGVLGTGEEIVSGCQFDHAAGIHDRHAIGDFGNDAKIVSDKDHRGAGFGLQMLEQAQDLGLRGSRRAPWWLRRR